MLYVAQRDAIVIDIFAKGSKERGNGVCRSDKQRVTQLFTITQSHNLGGASTHIDSDY